MAQRLEERDDGGEESAEERVSSAPLRGLMALAILASNPAEARRPATREELRAKWRREALLKLARRRALRLGRWRSSVELLVAAPGEEHGPSVRQLSPPGRYWLDGERRD